MTARTQRPRTEATRRARETPAVGATSRRRYLGLLASSSLGTVAGCLSAIENATSGGNVGDATGRSAGDINPEAYRISQDFHEERTAAGTSVPERTDLDAWEARGGSVTVDPDEPGDGASSLRLETDATTEQAIAVHSFDDPMDFTDRAVSIAAKWDRPREGWNGIALTLRDGSGDALQLGQAVETFGLNDWHRFDLGITDIDGDPDLAAIRTVEVWTWIEERASRVFVTDIRTTPTASKSYVLLHFDDIFEGAYTNAFPTLEKYGFPASGGTIIENIGGDRYMSRDQIDELAASGWEFCSHPQGERSLAEIEPAELEPILAEYKAWHAERGFADGLDYIIYPYGEINDETLAVVSRYHKLGFKVPRAEFGANVTSPLLVGRATGENVDEVKTAIDRAQVYNTVVPIMYHDVGAGGDWISRSAFDETMAYIDAADGVEVITTGDWVSMLSSGDVA